MNTKIGTSFGFALLMAIAVVATMFALGMFSTSQVRADHNTLSTNVHALDFVPGSSSVNSQTSWDVTFGVSAALVAGSGTITIVFPTGVVLPSTIDKSRISVGSDVASNGTYVYYPLTSDPTVTSTTVTLTVPGTTAAGAVIPSGSEIASGDLVKVLFSQLAGILNPPASGAAGSLSANSAGKVKTSGQTVYSNIQTVESFNRTISCSPTCATDKTVVEASTITVTVGGFTPDLRVTLSGSASGSAVVGSDRKAVITGTKKTSGTTITATDGAGLTATSAGSVTLKPELTVTASGKAGDTITLTGKNFTAGNNVLDETKISFGGTALTSGQLVTAVASKAHVDKDADGDLDDFSIKILIPSGATSGVNQVKVTDNLAGTDGVSATATVDVTGRSVTITPDSGPPGTVVTITGTGFPASRAAHASSTSSISPVFGSTTKTLLFTNGSGALPGSDQFTIPAAATASTITLTVSILGADSVASTGSDKFTVTSRVLTVEPASGPRGTKVLITGTKFTASGTIAQNTVTVDGETTVHTVANLTSSGDVPGISLPIPAGAGIGSKTISATDSGSLVGTTKFEITVPTLAIGLDSAYMGQSVPITGAGWVPSTSVTITLTADSVDVATKVATSDGAGGIDTSMLIPSTVGVGSKTVTFTAADASTYSNTSIAQTMKIPKPTIELSISTADIGDVVTITAAGFAPSSGLSVLTVGGADVRDGVVTSDTEGGATTSFIVPGVTGSNIVTITIGAESVSTSISVLVASTTAAAATTAPADIFADVIANDDNLVRVWRFSNADQTWEFYDPRAAFASANTLEKSGAGDIVWVNVIAEEAFQSTTLYPGWNLISLD